MKMKIRWWTLVLLAILAPAAAPAAEPAAEHALVRQAFELAGQHLDFSNPVIVGISTGDGVRSIRFLRPTSRFVGEGGRKPVELLLEVRAPEGWKPEVKPTASGENVSLARAAFAAWSHLAASAAAARRAVPDEFEIRPRRSDDGFSVLLQRIPFTPGAHTFVSMTPAYEVTRVMPGA
jgi:hypothetical protein